MTITITIRNKDLSPGELTFAYEKYLVMRRELVKGDVHWEENKE